MFAFQRLYYRLMSEQFKKRECFVLAHDVQNSIVVFSNSFRTSREEERQLVKMLPIELLNTVKKKYLE